MKIIASIITAAIILSLSIYSINAQEELFCGLPKSSYNVIIGTNSAEILTGTNGNDLIMALNGDDYIRAQAGNDCILSGYGDDYIDAGQGDDTILSGAGNDDIRTGQGNDTVSGGAGDDIILASSRTDIINGQAGNDICIGGITQNCEATKQDSIIEPTPVPAQAIPPIIPEKGYLVEEINGGLYWVNGGFYQAMFLVSDQGVIVVDAPPTIGQNMLNAISEVTTQPVTHFVYSHHHADHVGTAGQFSNATFIAQSAAAANLVKINDPNRPVPDITFEDDYTLTVGNQTLQLSYPGINHSPGNIFIYAPEQKVLMLVDVVYPGWVPIEDLAFADDTVAYVEIHDKILEFDFDVYVGGHQTRVGTPADIQTNKEYINDLMSNVRIAAASVHIEDAFARSADPQNIWLGTEAWFSEVSETCAALTIPKYIDVLGGVEVYAANHCKELFFSLITD